ncbi:HNH endonuclease signature motif containing protein [Antrihabitans sp. YC2-6]|uniref:HNH endonuclease signature motif containing protein n=1 Tax=Antrihabitans sp. YC2-6 TaxID=2799498 RepID=UPI0018F5007B|nr:HNH endonuclease signature motif containing protein [Antrihabitans sp. YC2-6]MBJ8348465.1 HNH endonuclease [Antrihabitans sp. YC2-6]
MSSSGGIDCEKVDELLSALDAVVDSLFATRTDTLSTPERLEFLRRVETVARRLPALGHEPIMRLLDTPSIEVGHRRIKNVLADLLRITPPDAHKRIRDAEALTVRTAMTGERLDPIRPHTAAAQSAGSIGREHVKVIDDFFRHLPREIDLPTRDAAEKTLADLATTLRPDELHKAADRLDAYLNPDGSHDEHERSVHRSFHLGKQGANKLSHGTFTADPELRAYLEVIFAKYAKPGMCDPREEHPVVDTEPTQEAARRDSRTVAQRQHDALKLVCRSMLASGQMGQHRGLPVTVIVTTTLDDLHTASGHGVTGGGSLLPMRDPIRMASHALHYLVVFDNADGRPLYLGRDKRLASADQRIVLHACDGGCTFPGCEKPGYWCQCHHCQEWVEKQGHTDIDQLTFACDHHHSLIGDHGAGWATIKTNGRTTWIPPAYLDPDQKPRVNHYFHPHEYLTGTDDDEEQSRAS